MTSGSYTSIPSANTGFDDPPDTSFTSSSSFTTATSGSGQSSCPSGCRCDDDETRFILFVNASTPAPRPYYYIGTHWILFHPWQIQRAVNDAGFTVIDKNDGTYGPVPDCGWNEQYTRYATGVRRGNFAINGTKDQPAGQPGINEAVDQLLRQTYPYVEIYLVVSVMMFVAFVLTSACWIPPISMCFHQRVIRRREKKNAARKAQPSPKSNASQSWAKMLGFEEKEVLPTEQPASIASSLIKLPGELQNNILSQCQYPELLNLSRSCTYYKSLIPDSQLRSLGSAWKAELFHEVKPTSYHSTKELSELACSSCLYKKPADHFSIEDHAIAPTARKCLSCNAKAGKYKRGAAIRLSESRHGWGGPAAQTRVFCVMCQRLKSPGTSGYVQQTHPHDPVTRLYEPRYWCSKCRKERLSLTKCSALLRVAEIVVTLTAMGLSCSGTMPARKWSWTILAVL